MLQMPSNSHKWACTCSHTLIRSNTYHVPLSMFSITSTRTLVIDLLAVHDDQRGRGLGSYLLKKLRSQQVSGQFSLIRVQSPSCPSSQFFAKNGFAEDPVLAMKFTASSLNSSNVPRTVNTRDMFYLSPIFASTNNQCSNYFNARTLSADVDSWRSRSLETYQEEVTMVLRLKTEVLRLTAALKDKDRQVRTLRSENDGLRNVIDSKSA